MSCFYYIFFISQYVLLMNTLPPGAVRGLASTPVHSKERPPRSGPLSHTLCWCVCHPPWPWVFGSSTMWPPAGWESLCVPPCAGRGSHSGGPSVSVWHPDASWAQICSVAPVETAPCPPDDPTCAKKSLWLGCGVCHQLPCAGVWVPRAVFG